MNIELEFCEMLTEFAIEGRHCFLYFFTVINAPVNFIIYVAHDVAESESERQPGQPRLGQNPNFFPKILNHLKRTFVSSCTVEEQIIKA